MRKVITGLAFAVVLMLICASSVCADGACEFAYKDELVDSDTQSLYTSETHIACRVVIKAATERFTFTEDGCAGCYCAEGLGSGKACVWEAFKHDCICHDMSNVSWFEKERPTAITLVDVEASNSLGLAVASVLFMMIALTIVTRKH